MEWWEDFQEESEGLLLVLHLGSDWSGSPESAPYMCWVLRMAALDLGRLAEQLLVVIQR